MKKLINDPQNVLAESLEGFAQAHSGIVKLGPDRRFVHRVSSTKGKVALVSGGGSGHEPLHAGFVGLGMLDAACPGQVFTSPTPDQILAAANAVDDGAGVLFIVKNYEGDVMNFDMAREMYGGKTETVITNDDVAVENGKLALYDWKARGGRNPRRRENNRCSSGSRSRSRGPEVAGRQIQHAYTLYGDRTDKLYRAGRWEAYIHYWRR
jgi:hypothetical protein